MLVVARDNYCNVDQLSLRELKPQVRTMNRAAGSVALAPSMREAGKSVLGAEVCLPTSPLAYLCSLLIA